MWYGGGRKKRRYPCTVEDPTISLYCRPRALAWRAPLHTQLRAVCGPQQTALRGLRNAVEEEIFSSDYPKPANPVLEIYRTCSHIQTKTFPFPSCPCTLPLKERFGGFCSQFPYNDNSQHCVQKGAVTSGGCTDSSTLLHEKILYQFSITGKCCLSIFGTEYEPAFCLGRSLDTIF